jgi:hypothetical protein
MRVDEPANSIQLGSAKAVAPSELDRGEPELARRVLSLDMRVWRLVAVEAGEEDPIRPRDALDPGHSAVVAPFHGCSASTVAQHGIAQSLIRAQEAEQSDRL